MTKTLDAGSQPPQGVFKPARIEFYVGNPPRQMLIFSGVALADTKSGDEDDLNFDEVAVKLGASTTPYFSYTCTVGLASINCDDSDFNFYGNESWVVSDQATGELILHATTGVSGDNSALSRFSYHVQVLSDPVTSLVAGTIRWASIYGQPSDLVKNGDPMFQVEAGIDVEVPNPGSPFRKFIWQPLAKGFASSVPVQSAGVWAVPYVILGVPLGQPVVIKPDSPGGNLVSLPSGYVPAPQFNPQTRIVELTPAAPSAVGVDFDMLLPASPK
jgi:hypothetical protein